METEERTPPPTVSTLLGHRQIDVGLRCLASLVHTPAAPIRLRVFDDGTLSEADAASLRAQTGCEIVGRADADARADEFLVRYPRASKFRRQNPLGLKLLDVALWNEGAVRYCDADVLFLRPVRDLWEVPPRGALFMRDVENAYAIGGRHLVQHAGLKLMAQVNTGIVITEARVWDLDRIEWFLGLPGLRPGVWVEQTCWAMLAAAGGCRLLDPRQFAIPMPGWKASGEEVALHFVSPVRGRMAEWPLQASRDVGPDPVAIRTQPAPRLGLLGLMRTRVARRLRRLVSGG